MIHRFPGINLYINSFLTVNEWDTKTVELDKCHLLRIRKLNKLTNPSVFNYLL